MPPARMVSFGYDARNRLTSTSYGDGSPGVSRSYTADGLPWTVNSGPMNWTYGYNNRRLLTSETLHNSATVSTYRFDWGSDANGRTAWLRYPTDLYVYYSPNALGEPTQVSGYASNISYYPNGAIAGYTLANGVAHSLTQNVRGLPWVWRDAGVVQDAYTYDANANVVGIIDQQQGLSSRSMDLYDGLDWLTAANGIWGAGSFGYDALDNLRSSTVGTRSTEGVIDGANRLGRLSINGAPLDFYYDAYGNLVQRGSQTFSFDIGNRLRSATGKASYTYDGHARRAWLQFADGTDRLQLYSQGGKLLLSRHSSQGYTAHIYLGERLIAETNSVSGTQYAHTDALGSPVARTNGSAAILSRTRYEPYGATAAGTNPNGIGYTGHVNDPDTGLVYMQQRYYDPVAGRFLSVDPVTTDAKTGGFFGRYHYANNNPYKFKDLDGRAPGSFDCDCSGGSGMPTSPIVTLQIIAIQTGASPTAATGLAMAAMAAVARGAGGTKATGSAATQGGRGAGSLKPDPSATGPHSTYKTNSEGKVTGHAEWKPNSQNPSGHDEVKRVDTQYANPHTHHNKATGDAVPTPHVHDRSAAGGVRPAKPDELPK